MIPIGILDTNGHLHQCDSYGHLDLAEDLVKEMGVTVKNRLKAEEYLQKLGYVIIRAHDVYGYIGYFKNKNSDVRYHLTEAQIDWLNKNYEYMLPDCRESVEELFKWDK